MSLKSLKKKLAACADLLFPPRCVFCGKVVSPGSEICSRCSAEILPDAPVQCMNLPVSGKNIRCVVLYAYSGKVRQSIILYKFYNRKNYSRFYAKELAKRIMRENDIPTLDSITAVPISRKREKNRGYNQSALIAGKAAKILGIPYENLLVKIRDNPEQHRLNKKERHMNVQGVYRTAENVTGKKILLVDDIITTGATLTECAETLYGAGASCVWCAAIAQAPI